MSKALFLGSRTCSELSRIGCLLQGDREKTAGMTVSPLMDRTRAGITKSQVGFFDIVALPLFKSMAQVWHGMAWIPTILADHGRSQGSSWSRNMAVRGLLLVVLEALVETVRWANDKLLFASCGLLAIYMCTQTLLLAQHCC